MLVAVMDANIRSRIDSLIRREVSPATGCTEPVAIALAVAYASSLLADEASSLRVWLSANMLKNAMGVGIPGTGKIGIPIAIALGAVLRCPERQLEVLDGFSSEALARAEAIVEAGLIEINLKEEPELDRLYIEVLAHDTHGNEAKAIIQKHHTHLHYLSLNGENRLNQGEEPFDCSETITTSSSLLDEDITLNFALVYDYATTAPLEDLSFIYEAALQNKAVGEYALSRDYGHGVGRMIGSRVGERYLGSSSLTKMLKYTSAACDARMDGAPMMVMSNTGSGNQGITATLPVLTFAEAEGCSREETTRALMMSSLLVVYIKQLLGRLSGLCGMVVSGVGSSAALVYLMGGSREQSAYAVQNMIGNVAGMICDGAKPSCSLKASTGVYSGMLAALLAMEHRVVTSIEGIVEREVDDTIANLATLGREAMMATDQKVLELMTNKKNR